jgi:hypothetical protein
MLEWDPRLHEDAAAQVTVCLNAQGRGVSVIHIAMTQTKWAAFATVWYTQQA